MFTPSASPAFNADSTNSLIAAWSFEELCSAIAGTIHDKVQSSLARVLRLYQVHWSAPRPQGATGTMAPLWREPDSLPRSTLSDAKSLEALRKTSGVIEQLGKKQGGPKPPWYSLDDRRARLPLAARRRRPARPNAANARPRRARDPGSGTAKVRPGSLLRRPMKSVPATVHAVAPLCVKLLSSLTSVAFE